LCDKIKAGHKALLGQKMVETRAEKPEETCQKDKEKAGRGLDWSLFDGK